MTSAIERAREVIKGYWLPEDQKENIAKDFAALLTDIRLEEAQSLKATVQAAFNKQPEAGPTDERIAFSWVLARCRERIAALEAERRKARTQ
jgi:hypothetical protein